MVGNIPNFLGRRVDFSLSIPRTTANLLADSSPYVVQLVNFFAADHCRAGPSMGFAIAGDDEGGMAKNNAVKTANVEETFIGLSS